MSSRARRMAARTALAAAAVALALAVSELALRALWCGEARHTYEWQSGRFLCGNPYWGLWHVAGATVEHRKSCFTAHYRTNAFGMKGDEVREGSRRVAFLGDSFVEGYGVDNEDTAHALVERALGPPWQVLNFGVSGGFTTPDLVAIHEAFVRFFRPEVVVAFFLPYNDLRETLDASRAGAAAREPPAATLAEAVARLERPGDAGFDPGWIADRLCIERLRRLAGKVLRDRLQAGLGQSLDLYADVAEVFRPAESEPTRRAWLEVERALGRLRDAVARDGAKLLVVSLADPYQVDEGWLGLAEVRFGGPLDASHPNRRLAAICERLGVRHHDVLPDARRAIRARGLRFPYLSFRCDRHYSPEGHRVVAESVLARLRAADLLGEGSPDSAAAADG